MICPRCNTDNPAVARFCLSCGEKLAEVCPRCGQALPSGSRFCLECGAKLAPSAAPQLGGSTTLTAAIQRLIPRELAERLLATRGQVSTERRLVTILFCDVKGSTAMGESLDPEDTLEIMSGAFDFLIPPIYRYEGTLAQIMGDSILAFFGAPVAHEDDPERAIRAGLEITAAAARYAEKLRVERGIEGFGVRVGINTGLVVVGELGSDLRVEYTAVGDAINLAARMEQNAPVGGVLVAANTHRLVSCFFDVEQQPPLLVKGKSSPVDTFLVVRARPRTQDQAKRGVEGIETRTIGREAELQILQDACLDAAEAGETHLVLVSGDAGVGKSRLTREFVRWLESLPGPVWLLRGRARAESRGTPYSVLRDLFGNHFEILESDGAATARSKFRSGMAGFLDADRADVVGQLSGFDFSASQAVQGLLQNPEFARIAVSYLLQYVRGLTAQRPLVMVLDDLQWADDSTLDLLARIAAEIPQARLLLLCLARPALFERRPTWGEGLKGYEHLALRPLSRRHSRLLVTEILQRVPTVPDELYDLILESAEGNPFYVEELIKMLIDEGVIARAAGPGEPWTVELPRIRALHVPTTLTGVLQARLDSLPHEARELLQRASVVGRVFWDGAVTALTEGDAGASSRDVQAALDTLRQRELILRRERSAFAGSQEYVFGHLILHNVTYETVLLKVRRAYHRRVATWLESNAGERAAEYAGLIAGHLESAGEAALAVEWLSRAMSAAESRRAWREVVAIGERALALVPAADKARRASLLVRLAAGNGWLGNYPTCRANMESALQLALEAGARATAAQALNYHALLEMALGNWAGMRLPASQALEQARAAGDPDQEQQALHYLGIAAQIADHDLATARRYHEQSLSVARQSANGSGVGGALNSLGELCRQSGDLTGALHYYEQANAAYLAAGQRWATDTPLFNRGEVAAALGDSATAERCFEEALAVDREYGGWPFGDPYPLGGLAYLAVDAGDAARARKLFGLALSEVAEFGQRAHQLYHLIGFARLRALAGDHIGAAEWVGLAMSHPAAAIDALGRARALLSELRARLPAEELEAALAHGAGLDLDTVVKDILAGL